MGHDADKQEILEASQEEDVEEDLPEEVDAWPRMKIIQINYSPFP